MHSVTDIARKFRNIEFELDFKLDFELDFWLNYLKIRRKSLCLLLEEEESRKSWVLQIVVECAAVVSKRSSEILRVGG